MKTTPILPSTAMVPSGSNQEGLSVILVTGGYDSTIRFWEAWSGVCSKTLTNQEHQINKISISPNKQLLAISTFNLIKLFDLNNTTAPIATLSNHTNNVTALEWHHQAKWLVSASEDSTIKIWDIRTNQPQRNYNHLAPVNDLSLHSNQAELISCDQDGSIKIWDLAKDNCSHELLPMEDIPMRSVDIASDGNSLVAGNHKGIVFVWSVQPGLNFTDLKPKTKFQAHDKYLLKVLYSPDTKHLATCSADTTIKLWSTSNSNGEEETSNGGYKLEKTLSGHQRWVWDMAFSADSAYLVSASSDHTARLWELASGTTVRQYSAHHKACVCVALNDSSS